MNQTSSFAARLRELRLPPSRFSGADPYKLARQLAKHGDSLDSMWEQRGHAYFL